MEALLSEINQTPAADLTTDVGTIRDIANTFRYIENESSTCNLLFTHFGEELHAFADRLELKLNTIAEKLCAVDDAIPFDSACKPELRCTIDICRTSNNKSINRAESGLVIDDQYVCNPRMKKQGFLNISPHELEKKIGCLENANSMPPALLLWETALHESRGRVQSALRKFISTVEHTPGEFSTPMMEISSKVTTDMSASKERLKELANWSGNLSEYGQDNIQAAECAIGLVSYALGEQNIYVAPEVITEIQQRHLKFLKEFA